MLAAFGLGMFAGRTEAWPYRLVADAVKTGAALTDASLGELPGTRRLVATPPEQAAAARIRVHGEGALADRVLFVGGRGQFAEECPGYDGCLAVEYGSGGEVVHAIPYRLDELPRATIAEASYEHAPGFSFRNHIEITGVSRYPGGDLLVVLGFEHSFPYGGGVARVGRDGRPIWYRKDYSHHAPHVTADGRALAPGLRLGGESVALPWAGGDFSLDCGQPVYLSTVQVLDGAGRLLEEIPVFDALAASPWASALALPSDPCDPLHINFAHEIGSGASAAHGLAPGDLVVSLRQIHAFGILDRETRELKRLVRGAFRGQHAVQHLDGSRFLMFDNGNGFRHGSRLLMVDLATGEETTLFPTRATPERLLNLFSPLRGHVSVSRDRTRAIVSYFRRGQAVEVRLADGALLTEFRSLHDGRRVDWLPEERAHEAVQFQTVGILYAD